MIIDVHTHIFPDKIAKRAVESLAQRAKIFPYHYGTAKELIELMEKYGIDYSVIQSIATNPVQTENVNNFAISLTNIPCLIPFGSIHPKMQNWKEELHRVREAGIKGIKLHPDYQDFFVDDKYMIPIYREIFDLGMSLLFHAGLDVGLPEPIHCTPQRVFHIMDEFCGKPAIFAHMGGEDLWDDVEKYMIGKDIFIDTSYSMKVMRKEQAERMIRNHGADKVLFGTDSPWTHPGEQTEIIRSLDLSDEDKERIFWENSFGLFFDK